MLKPRCKMSACMNIDVTSVDNADRESRIGAAPGGRAAQRFTTSHGTAP